MKKSIVLVAIFMMAISASSVFALNISGSIDTLGSPTFTAVGTEPYRYAHIIDTTNVINMAPGTAGATITGRVCDLGLGSTSSYLQIGLVAKERSDGPISWGNPSYMFNNSAFMNVGKNPNGNIYVTAGDTASLQSTPINLGTVSSFDYVINITPLATGPGGIVEVIINNTLTTSRSYGVDNWYGGTEEFYGSDKWINTYLIAQAYSKDDQFNYVSARLCPATEVVPEPGAILLGLGGLGSIAGYMRLRRR